MDIKSEQLAYWYLRLNGFLSIPNFVVHPDCGRNQETDIDILGVRFPYRAENLSRPMKDEPRFTKHRNKSYIIITEVKSGLCCLNGPWTNPERRNMLRVLRAIGSFPKTESNLVAEELYAKGHHTSQLYHVSLMCIGREVNTDISSQYPDVPQITWNEVLTFIYGRFNAYKNEKSSHQQWDEQGHNLWSTFVTSHSESQFKDSIQVL